MKVIGCFETTGVLCESVCKAEFIVIEGKVQPLLGRKTATELWEVCQFSMNELTFMGHVPSSRGVGVAAGKVKPVVDLREPESVSEFRSFFGLVNYNGRFIPELVTLSELLNEKSALSLNGDPPQLQLFSR